MPAYDATIPYDMLRTCHCSVCKAGSLRIYCGNHQALLAECDSCPIAFHIGHCGLNACIVPRCPKSYCVGCAPRCGGCRKTFCTAHMEACSSSQCASNTFCQSCSVYCRTCLRPVCYVHSKSCIGCEESHCECSDCPTFDTEKICVTCNTPKLMWECGVPYIESPEACVDADGFVCDNCVDGYNCGRCRSRSCYLERCDACKLKVCPNCVSEGARCAFRRAHAYVPTTLCREHAQFCTNCGNCVCALHCKGCYVCNSAVCDSCAVICRFCARRFCRGKASCIVNIAEYLEQDNMCRYHGGSLFPCPSCKYACYQNSVNPGTIVTILQCSAEGCNRRSCVENCKASRCTICRKGICSYHKEETVLCHDCKGFLCPDCWVVCSYCQEFHCKTESKHGRMCQNGGCGMYACFTCCYKDYDPNLDVPETKFWCAVCKYDSRPDTDSTSSTA